jgi:hypothetical protein
MQGGKIPCCGRFELLFGGNNISECAHFFIRKCLQRTLFLSENVCSVHIFYQKMFAAYTFFIRKCLQRTHFLSENVCSVHISYQKMFAAYIFTQ